MKLRTLGLMGLIATSSSVFAAGATLRIPIFIEGGNGVPAAEVNAKLKAAHASEIPTYIEVSTGDDGYDTFEALDKTIADSLKALGPDYEDVMRQREGVPGENDRPGHETCFKGDGRAVADVVASLSDTAYSDQLTVLGFKYKTTTKILTEWDEDPKTYLSQNSQAWKNWKPSRPEVLVLSSEGDDGTDVEESVIKPCK